MWERWNSYTKENGFGDAGMNSFNHYAFGAVGEWLYASVGGINPDPEQPGYRHSIIQPDPGSPEYGFEWAKTDLATPYGMLQSHWQVDGNKMVLMVRIPPNTTASIAIPSVAIDGTTESGHPLHKAAGLSRIAYDAEKRRITCEATAGLYRFVSIMNQGV